MFWIVGGLGRASQLKANSLSEQRRHSLGLEVRMRYKIALLKTDEGYSVSVPGLPGCWSQGTTEEEALQNIQDAIQEYLAARDELLAGAVIREVEVTG